MEVRRWVLTTLGTLSRIQKMKFKERVVVNNFISPNSVIDMIIKIAEKILEDRYVCDHCLGRQFAQLLQGLGNEERGKIIRDVLALNLEAGKKIEVDMSNFTDYKFRFVDIKEGAGECSICGDIFKELDRYFGKIEKKLKGLEFDNFLVGTTLSQKLFEREEKLWDKIGIEYCEPIKAEINRIVGRKLEKKFSKKAEFESPEIVAHINLENKDVNIQINPLFIYGVYKKFKKGIPQTKWPSGKYKTSIEEIIAKPFLKATKGKGEKFHGKGREDIDAKCTGGRPFILEIQEPIKRDIDFSKIRKKLNGGVRIFKLKKAGTKDVERIKSATPDKTYKVIIETQNPVEKEDLKKIKKLADKKVYQETPHRVLHRRADKLRRREIKDIDYRIINKRKIKLYIRAESGTYIKEFITGDKGRTYPSVSEMLRAKAEVKELDVIKIQDI